MKINNIELKNFRNFEQLACSFDDVNIIWGENAQGKTNLIEAIYLFTGAKSFRGAKDKELIRFDKDKSYLKINFFSEDREQYAEIELEERRKISINGVKNKNAAALSEQLKAVVFSPVHLSMVKDGPSERRRFIDGALCQLKSNYRRLLKEYQRSLQQRNALLKDLVKHPEMEGMLYIWNQNLASTGAKIIYQRLKYIEALEPYLNAIFEGISRKKEKIKL
jgi:DNA replication and repair protein RecF